MPYHGFEATVYTLAIGRDQQKLNVQEQILMQIPHFRKALMNDKIHQDVYYIMERDDPEAVATVLAFVRDGALPVLETEGQKPHTIPSINDQIQDCIEAYIIALEWGLEAAQNAIVDKTCSLLRRQQKRNKLKVEFHPSVQAESFFYSKMYDLLCRQIAYEMQKKVQQRPAHSSQPGADVLNEIIGDLDWNFDILFSLTTHLLSIRPFEESPLEIAERNPCLYHVHTSTVACTKEESGGPNFTTSPLFEEVANHTDTFEEKDKDERGVVKRRARQDMLAANLPQANMWSDKSHTKAIPVSFPSQSTTPYPAKPQAIGRPVIAGHNRFAAPKFDHDNVKSKQTLANESITMDAPRDVRGSPWGQEGIETPSASTGILTPTSSMTSAAPRSTVHAVGSAWW